MLTAKNEEIKFDKKQYLNSFTEAFNWPSILQKVKNEI